MQLWRQVLQEGHGPERHKEIDCGLRLRFVYERVGYHAFELAPKAFNGEPIDVLRFEMRSKILCQAI